MGKEKRIMFQMINSKMDRLGITVSSFVFFSF